MFGKLWGAIKRIPVSLVIAVGSVIIGKGSKTKPRDIVRVVVAEMLRKYMFRDYEDAEKQIMDRAAGALSTSVDDPVMRQQVQQELIAAWGPYRAGRMGS